MSMEVFGVVDIPIWVILTVTAVVSYVAYMSWTHNVFRDLGITGPPPRLVMGNLGTILKKGMHGADAFWVKTYGKVVGTYMTRTPMLLIADDDILKQIMVKDFNNFPNRQELPKGMVGFPMDQALIFAKDNHWRFIRNFMTPTFSLGKMKQMVPIVRRVSDKLVGLFEEKADNQEDVEVKSFMEKYTMDVIAGTAFGMDVDALHNEDDPFVRNAKIILSNGLNSFYIVCITFFPFLIPLLSVLGYHLFPEQNMDFFVKVTNRILKERRSDPQSSRYTDFIQLMLNAEEETKRARHQNGDANKNGDINKNGDVKSEERTGLTNDEVNAAALLFFIAGYDTTSSSISFCLYNIATHPEVQRRLAEEIDQILGEEEPDLENMQRLEYLDMCVNETLRLYPPGVRVDRTCREETEIKGVKIPKGMTIGIPIYAIHHDEDRWHNPDQYDPDRFSPENRSKHGPFDFLPFGNGPRNCIGMRLALLELKVTLCMLFQRFRFSPCSQTQIPLKFQPSALLRPAHGLWLKIERR